MSWTRTIPGGGLVNVHSRTVAGTPETSAALLERIAEPGNPVWPSDRWPPLVLDDGLRVGSRGGHGPIRYLVAGTGPGTEVSFDFAPGSGLTGRHTFRVDAAADGRARWTHELLLRRPPRSVRHLVVPLHDQLLEDLLDGVEAAVEGRTARRRPFPVRVRLLRAAARAARAARARSRARRSRPEPPVASDG